MTTKPYSDWHKIDLHIHTDKSKETKTKDYKGDFSVGKLYDKLTENKVEIFSLTDHNTINIEAYKEYYTSYESENDPLLLVGVELDIEVPIENKPSKNYHSLLIFNYSDFDGASKISKLLENEYLRKEYTNPKDRKLTIEEISNIFYGNDQSIVQAYKKDIGYAQKMVILMQSALEKVTKEETRQIYNNGFDIKRPEDQQQKNDIAYINFSDNHNIDKYPCKHMGTNGNHCFDYIKGSKSYDSLRLAFIDPSSRIITQENLDKIVENKTNLDSFKINDTDFISHSSLSFSPSLNVIIGGRSSGKSLLLWLIGKSIDSVQVDKKTYDFRDKKNKKIELNTFLKTVQDSGFKKTIAIPKDSIIFLKQGEIVDYFLNNDLSDLAKKIDIETKYNEAIEQFKTHKNNLITLEDLLNSSYNSLHNQNQIKKEFSLQKKTIQSILNNEVTISFKPDDISKEIVDDKDIDVIIDAIKNINKNIQTLKSSTLIQIKEGESSIIDDFESLMSLYQSKLDSVKNRNNLKTQLIRESKEIIDKTNNSLGKTAQEKSSAIMTRNELVSDIASHFSAFVKLKQDSDNIEEFKVEKQETLDINEDLKLILDVNPSESIKEMILSAIKDSDINQSIFSNLLDLLKDNHTIKIHGGNDPINLKKKIKSELDDLKRVLDHPSDYLRYNDGQTSKQKSPGYNSEQYLKLILTQSKTKSIFIDQPEDNLGNKFISNDLVKIIREVKTKKQIFLVTHNPSIVVYGDAECVIIAENTNEKISYKQVKLEDPKAQKEICDILDGGEYIFNKRAEKYNIKKLKTK